MNYQNCMHLPIQYFAEGGELTSQEPSGGEPTGQVAGEAVDYAERIKTDKALQSFLDTKVQAATQTAVQKALEKERLLADEKATEAEKLAAMNEKERQAYELKKANDEISRLKAEASARGLKDQALQMAADKGVPAELAELIPFAYVKADAVAGKLDGIKTVYDKAVAGGIAKALDGAGTPKGTAVSAGSVGDSGSMFLKVIEENQSKRN